jgi:hypothetical protein
VVLRETDRYTPTRDAEANLEMRTKLWNMSGHTVQPVKERHSSCSICHEKLGKERLDGKTEYASMLPCSHVFGSICISRVC